MPWMQPSRLALPWPWSTPKPETSVAADSWSSGFGMAKPRRSITAKRRRHVPPVLSMAALALLLLGLARPEITTQTPKEEATVVLVADVSGSMNATDVEPTRLAAAQKSAESLLASHRLRRRRHWANAEREGNRSDCHPQLRHRLHRRHCRR